MEEYVRMPEARHEFIARQRSRRRFPGECGLCFKHKSDVIHLTRKEAMRRTLRVLG